MLACSLSATATRPGTSARSRALSLGAPILAALLTLTACGSSGGEPGGSTTEQPAAATSPGPSKPTTGTATAAEVGTVRTIALEEHVVLPEAESAVPAYSQRGDLARVRAALLDVAGQRLRAMDAGGVELSVLSLTSPGLQSLGTATAAAGAARAWNDALAAAIEPHGDRFRGFAALPMADPELAAGELRRAVRELGFVGGLVNGFDDSGGRSPRYYDDPAYLPFWREVVDLDTVVYLHPRTVPDGRETTYGPYPQLGGPAWGFHVETAEHVLRMMLRGVFDAVPRLRLILGHLGEMLPFLAWRIDHILDQDRPPPGEGSYALSVREYLRRNVWVTTSGFFDTAALRHALDVVGADRVLYSVDYPYESTVAARAWFDGLGLDDAVQADIGHRNARRLLKL